MPKILTFSDGVLVDTFDDRTVSQCLDATVTSINQQCADAIAETGISWMVEREVSGGKPVPQEVKDACAVYRAKANTLTTQANLLAAQATDDNDKYTCDLIEAIVW